MSNSDGIPNDPEALGGEREEYPDPESYPPPETPAGETPEAAAPAAETTDGGVPDPDITGGDEDGQT